MNQEIKNRTGSTGAVDANIALFPLIGDALALGPHWVYNHKLQGT